MFKSKQRAKDISLPDKKDFVARLRNNGHRSLREDNLPPDWTRKDQHLHDPRQHETL